MSQIALQLEKRISRYRPLTLDEAQALRSLGSSVCTATRGAQLIGPNDPADQTVLMHAGWAILYRDLLDGRRQIMQFCLPGDLVDPCNLLMDKRDFAIEAVTLVRYSVISMEDLSRVIDRHPGLALPLLWSEARELYMLRAHLLSVGRLTAKERLACLFLELWERLTAIDQVSDHDFQLHANQEMLADATGLSSVHVSRTLHKMEAEGLIQRHGHGYLLIDYKRLRNLVPDMLTSAPDNPGTVTQISASR